MKPAFWYFLGFDCGHIRSSFITYKGGAVTACLDAWITESLMMWCSLDLPAHPHPVTAESGGLYVFVLCHNEQIDIWLFADVGVNMGEPKT